MCIREYLRGRSVPFTLLLHPPAPTASQLAQSMRVPGQQVAKAVLVRIVPDVEPPAAAEAVDYVLAVLPATHRVELARLAAVLGLPVRAVRIASEDEVERVFQDCERGALPPFGHLYGLTTVVDTSLAAGPEIVVEGNLRHEGLRIRYRDYEAVVAPTIARFATPTTPRRRGSIERQAG